ncbi:PLP-dependent aminotransferase family protein [Actinomycetes bacterium KLBMP 9797]
MGHTEARLPVIQFAGAAGVLDLGWGHPDPALLPVDGWAAATAATLRTAGWTALTYGYATGPGPLLEWLAVHIGSLDGRAPDPAELFVTAGTSQGIDMVCALLTRPGDVVLVDAPTYHLALRILANRDVELRAAPMDGAGIDPAATVELIARLQRTGRRAPMLYTVPTFNNPSGASVPPERRRDLVTALAGTTTIVEDDTYRELAYDGPAPPSLWSAADGGVVRLGSFSKTVGPGLRLGYLTAEASFVRRLATRGYVDSGGCLNHTTAMVLTEFGTSGGYARHVAGLREAYRERRDALADGLRAHAPELMFDVPAGGWFLWLRAPEGLVNGHGVALLAGECFYVDGGGRDRLRASFSMYGVDDLREAARRLGLAIKDMHADQGLGHPE